MFLILILNRLLGAMHQGGTFLLPFSVSRKVLDTNVALKPLEVSIECGFLECCPYIRTSVGCLIFVILEP